MEAELTEALKQIQKLTILAITEEASVDEAINSESKDSNKMEIYLKE